MVRNLRFKVLLSLLFACTIFANENVTEYIQPTGAHDCYSVGEFVYWNSAVYQSKINANVWSPTDYPAGWQIVAESTNMPTITEYIQPTGAHDSYGIGDKILFNNDIYESTINGNVWTPEIYPLGWNLILDNIKLPKSAQNRQIPLEVINFSKSDFKNMRFPIEGLTLIEIGEIERNILENYPSSLDSGYANEDVYDDFSNLPRLEVDSIYNNIYSNIILYEIIVQLNLNEQNLPRGPYNDAKNSVSEQEWNVIVDCYRVGLCERIRTATNEALKEAGIQYPELALAKTKADAFRHAFWNVNLGFETGKIFDKISNMLDFVTRFTLAHEQGGTTEGATYGTIDSKMDEHNNQFGSNYLWQISYENKYDVEFNVSKQGAIAYLKSQADAGHSFSTFDELKWIKYYDKMAYLKPINANPVTLPEQTILRVFGYEKNNSHITISTANDEFFPVRTDLYYNSQYYSGNLDFPDIVTISWGDGTTDEIEMDITKGCRNEYEYCPNWENITHIYGKPYAGQYLVTTSYRGIIVSENIIDLPEGKFIFKFDYDDYWTLETNGTGQSSFDISNGSANIDITNSGNEVWDIELIGPQLTLKPYTKYDLYFEASAEEEKEVTIGIHNVFEPYNSFSGYGTFKIGKIKERYTYTFMSPAFNSTLENPTIVLQLGKGANTKIELDNVQYSAYNIKTEPLFENFQTGLGEGPDKWTLTANNGAVAEMHTISGISDIDGGYTLPYRRTVDSDDTSYVRTYISNSGNTFQDIVLEKPSIFLEAGKGYKLSFWANSEGHTNEIVVKITSTDKLGYETVYLDKQIGVTSINGWEKYSYNFKMSSISDKNVKLSFQIGNNPKNIHVTKVDFLLDQVTIMENK